MTSLKTFVGPLLKSNGDSITRPDESPIFWLDELLDGELRENPEPGRPLVVLLVGPPGAGKSLLAQQICHNSALNLLKPFAPLAPTAIAVDSTSLIITTETSPKLIVDNLERLGFVQPDNKFVYDILRRNGNLGGMQQVGPNPFMFVTEAPKNAGKLEKTIGKAWGAARSKIAGVPQVPRIVVVDSLNILATDDNKQELFDSLVSLFQGGPAFLFLVLDTPTGPPGSAHAHHAYWEYVADASIRLDYGYGADKYFSRELEIIKTRPQYHSLGKYLFKIFAKPIATDPEGARPNIERGGIFVFPSLHYVLSKVRQGNKLVKADPKRPLLQWAVVNPPVQGAPRERAKSGPGEIAPPVGVERKDERPKDERPKDKRVKWGRYELIEDDITAIEFKAIEPERERLRERVLSELKQLIKRFGTAQELAHAFDKLALANVPDPAQRDNLKKQILHLAEPNPPATLNWPVEWCFEMVGGGVPLNQCTALVGRRGARKSYFGYQFLLDGVMNEEKTLLISFRDNPTGIEATLRQICSAPQYDGINLVPGVAADSNLLIIYQRPGYVSPEELMHRVITSIGEHAPTRVLINAIDQWEASYPLLAKSGILLSALIDFLNTHEATSMIVGVGGEAELARYGVTAKAEVVLSFGYKRVAWPPGPFRPSVGPVEDAYALEVPLRTPPQGESEKRPKIVVRAERVPRGGAGFGRAILENTSPPNQGETVAGLTMIPLAPEYPEGDAI